MGIVYDCYKKELPVEYKNFWTSTTTDGVLKEDPYKFVGGSVSIKPSSQAWYIFLRDWDNYQKEMEARVNMEKLFAINHILKNGDYTTVIWKDGTKTIVKKASDEPEDPEKALLFAMLKKVCGNNGSKMSRYLKEAEEKTVVKMPKIKIRERNDGSSTEDDLPECCKDCIHRHEEVEPGNACYLCFNNCNKETEDDPIHKAIADAKEYLNGSEGCKGCIHKKDEVTPDSACYRCLKECAKEFMISNVKYLRKCGYSYKKIADELKLSESTVRRYSSKEDKENE